MTFTSYRDDAWDGDSDNSSNSSGNPGDWAGLYFTGQDNIFDQAIVRYAGITINGPAVTVRRSEFQHFSDPAIHLQAGGEGSTVHQTNFLPDNNAYYGIQNSNTAYTLPAENNYWNDTDDTGPSGVGGGNGCGVSDFVSYTPWRATPADISWVGPSITSMPGNFAVQALPYQYDSDNRPDTTDSVTWTKVQGPDEFSIHPTTGEIIWVPDVAGDYVLIVSAVDDEGAHDHIWQVHVGPYAETDPPSIVHYDYEIESMGGSAARAIITAEFNEGVQIRPIDAAIMDDAGQTLTLSSISYDIAGKALTVVAENLVPNDAYTFQLMDTITDDMGNKLDGDFDGFTFPTGDQVAGGDFVASFMTAMSEVAGRHVFYNNSTFDGNDPAAGQADDAAIAPDKVALLPGQAATTQHYTSYSRGINGIMVDLVDTVDASFGFRVGNSPDPNADWTEAPAPAEITVRPGEGVDGSDRYSITWADNDIMKEWLQVTVSSTHSLGRVTTDVFYYGNALGECGLFEGDTRVTVVDMLAARANPRNFANPADIDFAFDYNRDGRVNAADQLIARYHSTNYLTALKLLDTPGLDETLTASQFHAAPATQPMTAATLDTATTQQASAEEPVLLQASDTQASMPTLGGALAGQDETAPTVLAGPGLAPASLTAGIAIQPMTALQTVAPEAPASLSDVFESIGPLAAVAAPAGTSQGLVITPLERQSLDGNVFHVEPRNVSPLAADDLVTDLDVDLNGDVFQEL